MFWEGEFLEDFTEEVTYDPCLNDELRFMHRRGKGYKQAERQCGQRLGGGGSPLFSRRLPGLCLSRAHGEDEVLLGAASKDKFSRWTR